MPPTRRARVGGIENLATEPGKGRPKNMNTKYLCSDENGEIEVEATSPEEAAQWFADAADWGDFTKTIWVDVRVTPISDDGEPIEDEREHITITLDPEEPPCVGGKEHEWCSPYEVVGGLKENPGVWGHGGGVIITEACPHCGRYRVTDTWAQNPADGSQGHTIEYRKPDEASLAWVRSSED